MPKGSGGNATKKGIENLKPQNTRTKAEQREIARKGGKASGEARREKKLLKDTLLLLLETDDGQGKICNALFNQAKRGNIKAFEVIRDTIGEKPIDRKEVGIEGKIQSNPYDELSVEELRALARKCENEEQS